MNNLLRYPFLAGMLLLFACGGQEVKTNEAIRPVAYRKVMPGGGEQQRTFSGSAKSGTETKLSFKVSGNIERLMVKVGQEVNRGQMIAALDNADLNLQYEQADASVKNADAQEKQAKSNFERIRSLYENGSTSLSDYEAALAAFESAKANESSLKKSRKLAKAQLEYCQLYAPVSGKIATVDVEVNENVNAGQQIVLLSSKGDPEVRLGLPETFISSVEVDDEVDIVFAALSSKTFKGVVTEVSFSISAQTSTYPVVVKVTEQSDLIRPGMAASVTFKLKSEAESSPLVVPASAVGEDENGNFVFALEAAQEDYLVMRRAVRIGELKPEGFEILAGLDEGELVATAGLQTLLDGMKVRLFNN